jgi:hypothetical protein
VARRKSFGPPARTATISFFEHLAEVEPMLKDHWTHACKWEGSLVMVAAPGTVHLDQLPRDAREIPPAYLGFPYLTEDTGYDPKYHDLMPGILAMDPRRGTSARYGRRQIKALLGQVAATVTAFLEKQ